MVTVKKSLELRVITFKEKGVIAHPFHTEDLSLASQRSCKMLYRMKSDNGREVDTVFC